MNRVVRLVAVAVLPLIATAAAAEVRVDVDRTGAVSPRVEIDFANNIIWGQLTLCEENRLLNAHGDRLRDGQPVLGVIALPADDPMNQGKKSIARRSNVDPAGSRNLSTPVAVWTRFDGTDEELVYSLWDYRASVWRAPAFVERSDNSQDDVRPTVFVRGEILYLLWIREGSVYLSTGYLFGWFGSYDVFWSEPRVVAAVDTTPMATVLDRVVAAEALGGGPVVLGSGLVDH